MDVTVKAHLQTSTGEVEVRRFPLSVTSKDHVTSGLYSRLMKQIAAVFPSLNRMTFSIMWKDADGDMIIMSSDDELTDALAESNSDVLKVFVEAGQPISDFDSETELVDMDGAQSEPVQGEDQGQGPAGNHDRPDPFNEWPFMGPLYGPPPHLGWGRGGRRGRPWGLNHPMFSHGGPGHFRALSAHSPPPHGPVRGRGRHGGMWCPPLPPPHFVGEEEAPSPHFPPGSMRKCGGGGHGMAWTGCRPHRGHHSLHSHHGHHGQGTRGWKRAFGESIPKPHRRWAKSFIRNWRLENLTDATTTSDSDAGKKMHHLDREAHGVPMVYQLWLEFMLPRWHSSWGGRKTAQEAITGEKQKNPHKDDVPFEFRKWTRWFLNKHFGSRSSPKLRRRARSETNDEAAGCKKAGKGHAIRSAVPMRHRGWAKRFILAWRLENKIPTEGVVTSEGESTDAEAIKAVDEGVPEDYAAWLRIFLTRWHKCRGVFNPEAFEVERPKKNFQETVPMEFRTWVKFHMCQRYGKMTHRAMKSNDAARYQMWLEAFKKRWLTEQGQSDSDGLYLTSSDEEAFQSDHEMERGLKKLRLSDETCKKKKSVKFDPQYLSSDSDDGAGVDMPYRPGKFLDPEFRKFAKKALFTWDGQPGKENEILQRSEAEKEELPPFAYRWMMKKMMKMQMKKMKQQKRAMKQEMKAAAKMARRMGRL